MMEKKKKHQVEKRWGQGEEKRETRQRERERERERCSILQSTLYYNACKVKKAIGREGNLQLLKCTQCNPPVKAEHLKEERRKERENGEEERKENKS